MVFSFPQERAKQNKMRFYLLLLFFNQRDENQNVHHVYNHGQISRISCSKRFLQWKATQCESQISHVLL